MVEIEIFMMCESVATFMLTVAEGDKAANARTRFRVCENWLQKVFLLTHTIEKKCLGPLEKKMQR